MNSQDAVIIACSYYPLVTESEKIRAEISKRTVKKIIDAGYQVVIVDGGSGEELLTTYRSLGAQVHMSQKIGLGVQRKEAIKQALLLDPKVIVWMEMEKEPFVQNIKKIIAPLLADTADIVVPKRISLASYPTFQQQSEKLGNMFWDRLTQFPLDLFFGPRAWKKDMSSYFLDYTTEYGDTWEGLILPLVDALHNDKRILSIDVDYTHPKEQTAVEENDSAFDKKRVDQLAILVHALYSYWKKLPQ